MLYPDAEDADLDQSLGRPALTWLIGEVSPRSVDATLRALSELAAEPVPETESATPVSEADG